MTLQQNFPRLTLVIFIFAYDLIPISNVTRYAQQPVVLYIPVRVWLTYLSCQQATPAEKSLIPPDLFPSNGKVDYDMHSMRFPICHDMHPALLYR